MTSTDPGLDRAQRYVRARDYAAAITLLDEYLHSHPDDVEALNLLGRAAFESGRLDIALGGYQRMWSLAPTDVRALYGTGMTLLRQGKPADAETWFTATLTVDPSFERAAQRLAEAESRATPSPGTSAGGAQRGRRAMSSLIVPEDEEELQRYRRTSRDKARIDTMNQYWHGLPWPIRVLQVVVAVVIVVGIISTALA